MTLNYWCYVCWLMMLMDDLLEIRFNPMKDDRDSDSMERRSTLKV